MCRVLGVSRSRYYARLKAGATKRQREDRVLLAAIKTAFDTSGQTYGAGRIVYELREDGIRTGKNRVWRLMKQHGLCGSRPPNASRLQLIRSINASLRRTWFNATSQPRLLTGSGLATSPLFGLPRAGWHLAVVLDVFSRRIIGWSMKNRMTDELVVTAFKNAVLRRRPAPGLIVHSDRGSQYCSKRFQSLLKGTGGLQSMNGVGCCYDNAVTESFFGTLKRELVHHCSFRDRAEAQSRIFRYIEVFYNRQRRHSAVSYQSPDNYERLFFKMAA